ncbi:hypothetical protein [Parerythrobacter jejuensis]|uniref:Uncharacterized protein n=1 Tax=Parerythrobacter jejuensis TaxID=795812 RepID=A0A845AR89_9SPHN|nr:hypothetical protein [Parerythrobacter jejuensis]MXP31999.1 hypothetical protein [Parerythrobacter jejuensis]
MSDEFGKEMPASSEAVSAPAKRPYTAPVLHSLDASETRTGPKTFTQEILTLFTPS